MGRTPDAGKRAVEGKLWFEIFGGFADEDEATVRVGDMEFGHAIVAIEQVADAVAVLEGLHVLPQIADADNFDVDLRVFAHGFHDGFIGGALEVDGLAVALDDGVVGGVESGCEAEDRLEEGEGSIHVVGGKHGRDADGGGRHEISGKWRIARDDIALVGSRWSVVSSLRD